MTRRIATGLVGAAAAVLFVGGAGSADGFEIRKLTETGSAITLGWNAQPGDGYRFYANGVAVSRTFDPSRTQVRFSKAGSYRVEVLHVTAGMSGSFPPPVAPPPVEADATVKPGASWDAAFKAADSGDTILVLAGNHGTQTFTNDASKTSRVTFRGEPGASVTDLNFKGAHVAVENILVGERWYAYPGAKNVLVTNVSSERFYIRCGIDITVRGGVYSDPAASGVPSISSGGGQSIPSYARADCPDDAAPSRNIVLDSVVFEKIWRPQGDTSSHRECLHVMGVDGLVARNLVFRECLGNTAAVSFNIHFSSRVEGVVFENVLVERTYQSGAFPQPTGTGPSVNISDRPPGYEITFRNCRLLDGSPVVPQGHPVYPGAIRFESCVFGGAPNMGGAAPEYVWDYTVER